MGGYLRTLLLAVSLAVCSDAVSARLIICREPLPAPQNQPSAAQTPEPANAAPEQKEGAVAGERDAADEPQDGAVAPEKELSHEERMAVEQLEFANGLFSRGIYKMAITEYENFIRAYPNDAKISEAKFAIGESYFFLEAYNDAVSGYRNYLKDHPQEEKAAEASLRIGEAFFLNKEYDKALAELVPLTGRQSSAKVSAGAYYYAARSYQAKGDSGNAAAFFTKAAEGLGPNEYIAYAYLNLGEEAAKSGNYDGAISYFSRCRDSAGAEPKLIQTAITEIAETEFTAGRYDEAARSFRAIIENAGKEQWPAEALSHLLYSLYNQGKFEELAEVYRKYADAVPKDNAGFESHFIAAQAYKELKEFDKFMDIANRLSSSDWVAKNDVHRVLFKKAEVLLLQDDYGEALVLLTEGIKDPEQDKDRLLYLKGEALYGLERYDESAEAFKKLRADFPNSDYSEDALYSISYALLDSGKNEAALSAFMEYFQNVPDSERGPQALYHAILLDISMGDSGQAIGNCKVFLSTYADHEIRRDVLFRLGSLYTDAGRYDEAVGVYKEFLDIAGGSPTAQKALFLMGYDLQMLERYDEALSYYWKIKETGDRDGMYYLALKNAAQIYAKRDDYDKAAETFNLFIGKFPDNDLTIESYLWTAKYFIDKERFDDALKILEDAGKKDGTEEERLRLAYFKGEAYRGEREFDMAIKSYATIGKSKADEARPLMGAVNIGRGLCYAAKNDAENAMREFESALTSNYEDADVTMRARFEIANLQFGSGNYTEAAKMYMMVAILYENEEYCTKSLLKAGEAFEAAGERDKARAAYEEIISKYTSHPLADTARKKLAVLKSGKS